MRVRWRDRRGASLTCSTSTGGEISSLAGAVGDASFSRGWGMRSQLLKVHRSACGSASGLPVLSSARRQSSLSHRLRPCAIEGGASAHPSRSCARQTRRPTRGCTAPETASSAAVPGARGAPHRATRRKRPSCRECAVTRLRTEPTHCRPSVGPACWQRLRSLARRSPRSRASWWKVLRSSADS